MIIASYNSLISAGIQAFIGMCDIDVKYLNFNGLDDILKNYNRPDQYIVLHHSILKADKHGSLQQLSIQFKGKILVLGTNRMDANFHRYIIFPADNEDTIITKLDDFFTSSNQTKLTESTSDVLSARETDILKEVALGYSNKEIADRLFISINTVITHRKNITDKLGIKTISGLTVYALMNNLINPNDVTL